MCFAGVNDGDQAARRRATLCPQLASNAQYSRNKDNAQKGEGHDRQYVPDEDVQEISRRAEDENTKTSPRTGRCADSGSAQSVRRGNRPAQGNGESSKHQQAHDGRYEKAAQTPPWRPTLQHRRRSARQFTRCWRTPIIVRGRQPWPRSSARSTRDPPSSEFSRKCPEFGLDSPCLPAGHCAEAPRAAGRSPPYRGCPQRVLSHTIKAR